MPAGLCIVFWHWPSTQRNDTVARPWRAIFRNDNLGTGIVLYLMECGSFLPNDQTNPVVRAIEVKVDRVFIFLLRVHCIVLLNLPPEMCTWNVMWCVISGLQAQLSALNEV